MARGVRKTPIEKLNEELIKTKDEIVSHKNAIKSLEEKYKQLEGELKLEELKELSNVLEDNNISITELKDLIINKNKTES
ncbi:hypothetical protein [Clostridium sp. HBUAS56010]|uniref:hypothetical protein n=1 Tax=Clostridium sp. HBUAS56010 TaxID=2571127 RepID=UPI001177C6D8|nr:hypothetical protein [Clostridium sp. HBUAS56010]